MWDVRKSTALAAFCVLALLVGSCGRNDRQVGGFHNDLMGNGIKIEALVDPDIPGVVCHLAYFDRGFLDRISQGNWFENPSNSAVTCERIGPIDLGHADLGSSGHEIFNQGASLLFKRLALRRIVDLDHRTILYVAHSRELIEGSAKISMSSVTVTEQEAGTAHR